MCRTDVVDPRDHGIDLAPGPVGDAGCTSNVSRQRILVRDLEPVADPVPGLNIFTKVREPAIRALRWQQLHDGRGIFILLAKDIPVHCRPGSVVYFFTADRIECSVVAVDFSLSAQKWLRFCSNPEIDRWRWKRIKPEVIVTWVGLRDADTYERIVPPPISYLASWKYIQLDPSPRQRRLDAQLVRQYLQERKTEWPSQPKGS